MSTSDEPVVVTVRPELDESRVPIESVQPHPRNARRGNLSLITASLREHGQYKPIIVQASTPDGEPRNYIVSGNHTWRAAKEELGWVEIAVSYVVCTDDEALRILLVDNRASDVSTYDDPLLAEILRELAATPVQLEGTGFTVDDLEDLDHLLKDTVVHGGGLTPTERTAAYEASGIKTIVLPYSIADHERAVKALTALRFALGVDSFAAVVLHLTEKEVEARAEAGVHVETVDA